MNRAGQILLWAGWMMAASAHLGQAAEFTFFEPIAPPRPQQVMVHRGASRQAPENTRPALQRCIEDGFEWAEVDVRRTKDGHHVLAHGSKLAAGGKSLEVAQSTLAELRALDLGSPFAVKYRGERVLTLAECFQICRGKLNLYLDCKAADLSQLAREILAAGMERQVVIYEKAENLPLLHQAGQGKLALMTKWRPGIALTDWAQTNHLAAVEIDANQVSAEVVASCHALGLKVQTKNLDEWDAPNWWDRAIAAGADWIQTDLPEEVHARALWKRLPQRPVRFSLHRGANRYAPENTVPAFEKSIRLGADFVEFDVRTTSDGKFYLLHDSTLDGKTDGTGPIRNTPAEAIAKISAGVKFGRAYADLRLPTLDEFLACVAGQIDLYFDAKDIPPEALVAAVRKYHMEDRTVVYQSAAYLKKLLALEPRLRALPPLGEMKELEALAQDLKPYAVDADWELLSADMIARCHALGIKVFSDALGRHENIADYRQAMSWGIDVIQTDHPLRLMRAMELQAAK